LPVTRISFSNLRRFPSGSIVVRMPRMARRLVRDRSSSGRISAPKYTSDPTNGKVISTTSTYTQMVLRPVLMQWITKPSEIRPETM
jgi:hypothetical protein